MSTRLSQIIKDINRSNTLPLSDRRVLKNAFRRQDEAVSLAAEFVAANIDGNQLIRGGATWLTGLTFYVSDCAFVIDGELFTSLASQVTLSAAHATHPRIDVIAVNKNGSAEVVTGTAAASPVKPEVNPDTQVEVTFVTVAALATTPTGVSDTVIYDEDDDWTTGVSGSRVLKAATVSPYAGTKHVHFNAAQNGDYITFTSASTVSPAAFDKISFQIKNVDYGSNRRNRLRLAIYSGNNRVSGWIELRHGDYSFDGNKTDAYQLISIPFSDFNVSQPFDVLRVQVAAGTNQTISTYIDNIKYQLGAPNTNLPQYARLDAHNAWSKAQGTPITTLTDAATISWDASVGNVFQVTLTDNRTMGAPTGVIPGYTYLLHVIQDAGGTNTVTWNSVFKWAGGSAPSLSSGGNAADLLSFTADASGNLVGTLAVADYQ